MSSRHAMQTVNLQLCLNVIKQAVNVFVQWLASMSMESCGSGLAWCLQDSHIPQVGIEYVLPSSS